MQLKTLKEGSSSVNTVFLVGVYTESEGRAAASLFVYIVAFFYTLGKELQYINLFIKLSKFVLCIRTPVETALHQVLECGDKMKY